MPTLFWALCQEILQSWIRCSPWPQGTYGPGRGPLEWKSGTLKQQMGSCGSFILHGFSWYNHVTANYNGDTRQTLEKCVTISITSIPIITPWKQVQFSIIIIHIYIGMEMEGPGQVLGKTSIIMMYKIKLVLHFLFPLKPVNLAFLLLSILLLLHQPDLEIAKLCLPPSSPSKKNIQSVAKSCGFHTHGDFIEPVFLSVPTAWSWFRCSFPPAIVS